MEVPKEELMSSNALQRAKERREAGKESKNLPKAFCPIASCLYLLAPCRGLPAREQDCLRDPYQSSSFVILDAFHWT